MTDYVPKGWELASEQPFGDGTTAPIADAPPPETTPPTTAIPKAAGDNVLALLEDRAKQLATPEKTPPPQGLSSQQRFAIGILAAMDPDGYQKYVLPTLQLMQGQQQMEAVAAEKTTSREQGAFNALLSIAQRRDELAQREAAQKDAQKTRDANLTNTQENTASLIDQRTGLAELKKKSAESSAAKVRSTATAWDSLTNSINSLVANTSDPTELGVVTALRETAKAYHAGFQDYLASGTAPSEAQANQFEQELRDIQRQYASAAGGRAGRDHAEAMKNGSLLRRSMSPRDSDRFAEDYVQPTERVIGMLTDWSVINPSWLTQYGASIIGAIKGKVLPDSFLHMRADWPTISLPLRKGWFGTAVTQLESTSGKPILPADISDMTVEEFGNALKSLTSLAAGKYVKTIHERENSGFGMKAEWDHYNSVIRPALPRIAIELLESPQSLPAGTLTRQLRNTGELLVQLPGSSQLQAWTPDNVQDAVSLGRIVMREGYDANGLRRMLEGMKFTDMDIDNVLRELDGGTNAPK